MDIEKKKIILQVLPRLDMGGAEEGTVEISLFMKKMGWKTIVASSSGALVRKIVLSGIKHIELPLETKNPLKIFFNIFLLIWVIKKNKVKIVHARSRAPAWSAFLACKMLRGIKFVTTVHGAYQNQNQFKRLYNSIMTKGYKIIAISKFIEKYLINNFKFTKRKKENIVIIPRGVAFEKYDINKVTTKRMLSLMKNWEIPDGIPIILFPSRIASFKGHITLLKAIAVLKKDKKNKFFCLMVGTMKEDSKIGERLVSFINKNKLNNVVKFAGKCSDMPAAYKLCDIVVSPAEKPEGFGRIIVEAQAMQRPVIASAHGGSVELIKDNYNGFLFNPSDEYDLANKIKYTLFLTKEKKKRIVSLAYDLVKEQYNINKMCESNFRLYNSLI